MIRAVAAMLVASSFSLIAANGSAWAAERCVGPQAGCYGTLAAALDAAHDGETVRLAPGTFAGGVTVTRSVDLVGAGQRATIIRGGGPVLRIGTLFAATEPTVSIRGMTITGGRTTSSPESVSFFGQEGALALGGGIDVPPGKDSGPGATVTISDARISDNWVAPTAAVTAPDCSGEFCPIAFAAGGGIFATGALTLTNTTITGNRAGSVAGLSTLAADAYGGGIDSEGPLTIRDSRIDGNRAAATAPNGRNVHAGGIFANGGELTMTDTSVLHNVASLAAAQPIGAQAEAVGGGLQLSHQLAAARIANSAVVGNTARTTNTVGSATAFSGGLHIDTEVEFQMRDSVIAANRVVSATLGGSGGDADGDSGAGEMHGTLLHTSLTGNVLSVQSASGDVSATAGAGIVYGTLVDSEISSNHVRGLSPHGSAFLNGGGLVQEQGLALRGTAVRRNTLTARATGGSARGGGIFDAPIPDGPPGGPLVLESSPVIGNTITTSPGVLAQGGGLYLEWPLTVTDSPIAHNRPDQCAGCP